MEIAHADTVRDQLRDAFGVSPTHVLRIPRSITLLGDYCDDAGMSALVLPFDPGVWVAAAPLDEPVVRFSTGDPGAAIEMERDAERLQSGAATRELAAAVRRLQDTAPGLGAAMVAARGPQLPGDGTADASARLGLLAAMSATWGAGHPREEITRRAVRLERSLGREVGGAQQHAMTTTFTGAALLLDEDTNAAGRPVPIPEGVAFVVAVDRNEMTTGTADRVAHNERVVGMRLATALLGEKLGVDPPIPLRLGDIAAIDAVSLLAEELHPSTSIKVVSQLTGIPIGKLGRLTTSSWDIAEDVPVRGLAVHVFEEAERAAEAATALDAGDAAGLGRVLTVAHTSLREHLGTAQSLDRLCRDMRKAGAFGARLANGGIGGVCVAVCPVERAQDVVDAARAAPGETDAVVVDLNGGYSLV